MKIRTAIDVNARAFSVLIISKDTMVYKEIGPEKAQRAIASTISEYGV